MEDTPVAWPYHTIPPSPTHHTASDKQDQTFWKKFLNNILVSKVKKKYLSKNGHSLGISKTMFVVISPLCLRFGILKVSLLALCCTPRHHHQHLLLFYTDLFSRFHRHFLITSRLLLL